MYLLTMSITGQRLGFELATKDLEINKKGFLASRRYMIIVLAPITKPTTKLMIIHKVLEEVVTLTPRPANVYTNYSNDGAGWSSGSSSGS